MLGTKVAQLRDRRAELADLLEQADTEPATPRELQDVREQVLEALDEATDQQRKRLLHALVHDIRVTGRDHIQPTFRVPLHPDTQVRMLDGSVGAAGLDPAASASWALLRATVCDAVGG